jgi:hypothetical protein
MMAILLFAGAIALVFVLCALGVIWNGYVLSVLWGWFVVPTFGMQPLALAPAIGLALVASSLTHQYKKDAKSEKSEIGETIYAFSLMMVQPAMLLLVGWIVKHWL